MVRPFHTQFNVYHYERIPNPRDIKPHKKGVSLSW